MSMNKITIIGNLGRDPEMRYTPGGDAVTNFSVATNYSYRTRDGQAEGTRPSGSTSALGADSPRSLASTYPRAGRSILKVG